jgi:hypothetical protein
MLMTQNTQDFIDSQSHAAVPATPDTLLTCVINRLVVECQRIETSKPGKSGPGSEYCNHAGPTGDIIHKHEKNPNSVLCTNCGKKSHDANHCYAKGGGMEGQGPKPKAKAKGRKLEMAAIASASSVPPPSPPDSPAPATYVGDLSCAMIEGPSIEDFASLLSASGGFASILDSGTSSHLLKDWDAFWTYEVTQAQPMKMANHGVLQTKASGPSGKHAIT